MIDNSSTIKGKTIAVVNQKGGVAKTTTVLNLAAALTNMGFCVLAVDCDPQSSLTLSMTRSTIEVSMVDLMLAQIDGKIVDYEYVIVKTTSGDLLPATLQLSGIEATLYGAMHREHIIEEILVPLKSEYDFLLLDCPPTLGMMTINALTAADSVLIPVVSNFLSLMGLQDLLTVTIPQVKRRLNKRLAIEGILPTMTTKQRVSRDMLSSIREAYGNAIHIFDCEIPLRAAVQQASAKRTNCITYTDSDAGAAYFELAAQIGGVDAMACPPRRKKEA